MTDADTDGAHIRTLLLTFFYKKLPEIIRNGNLYVAQPPLYKVVKKGENIYLENDKFLRQYIKYNAIEAIEVATHCLKKKFSSKTLRHLFYICTNLTNLLYKVFRENIKIFLNYLENIEINIIFNIINQKKQNLTLNDIVHMLMPATNIETILFKFNKLKNTIYIYIQENKYELDLNIFLNDIILKNFFIKHYTVKYIKNCNIILLRRGAYDIQARNVIEAFLELYLNTKNNLPIQRYKGLGEMNPEQLWDTTMCPLKRRLKKVKVLNSEYTKNIFDTLMGSDVVRRRNFIISNTIINKDIY
jgi:DNA gyrase subunit B